MSDLVKLLLTFALTTVAGGAVTAFYQWTVWQRQQWANREALLRKTREEIFSEVSRLLDRGLYRLRQMVWRAGDEDSPLREHWINEYRTVVTDWNDSINRLLAMLQIYMSKELREVIDNDIGNRLSQVGRDVMDCVTERRKPGANLDKAVRVLAGDIYVFNIKMLQTFDEHHALVSDKSSAAGGRPFKMFGGTPREHNKA